jgi:hypothetical protein
MTLKAKILAELLITELMGSMSSDSELDLYIACVCALNQCAGLDNCDAYILETLFSPISENIAETIAESAADYVDYVLDGFSDDATFHPDLFI